jgi:hypothetical protein
MYLSIILYTSKKSVLHLDVYCQQLCVFGLFLVAKDEEEIGAGGGMGRIDEGKEIGKKKRR